MFHCKFSGCIYVSENVSHFIKHIKLHSNTPNYHDQCGVPDCTLMYNFLPASTILISSTLTTVHALCSLFRGIVILKLAFYWIPPLTPLLKGKFHSKMRI